MSYTWYTLVKCQPDKWTDYPAIDNDMWTSTDAQISYNLRTPNIQINIFFSLASTLSWIPKIKRTRKCSITFISPLHKPILLRSNVNSYKHLTPLS